MRLEDLDFIRLLPQFMRKDQANISLASGVDGLIQALASKIELLSTWDHIDDLDHEELDALAWELNIEWYDKNATLETKRTLAKESDIVHARLGTAWAVEQVVKAYLGESEVQEWFEYGGDPHYFKLFTTSLVIEREDILKLLWILERVKRKSAWLDGIVSVLRAPLQLYVGAIFKDFTTDRQMFDYDYNDITAKTSIYYGHIVRQRITYRYTVEEG